MLQTDNMTTKSQIIFGVDSTFKRASEARVKCGSLFQRQHQLTTEMLIICKYYSDIYYLNIFRIIAII